jgi:Spy/CpxP family protein refolding chaperone
VIHSKLRPWLVMGLIFVAGMVSGAALAISFRSAFTHPPGIQQLRNHWLTHLTERLHLSPDQQAKIEPILTAAGNQIQALHHEEIGRISQIMATANQQISPLLTPDQQAELKTMESERQHTFSGHGHPWGEPHGDGGPEGAPPPP